MTDDDIEFEDMESGTTYSKEDRTIRSIVLKHIEKICLLSCNEFTGGYFNTTSEWHGDLRYVKKTYVPDSRARYTQAIDRLYDLLKPFFDKSFNKADEEIQKMKTDTPENKLEKARKTFQELNMLLHRKDYLSE